MKPEVRKVRAAAVAANLAAKAAVAARELLEEESESCILYDSSAVSAADEIITVCGQSMEPQFHDGDRVLVQYCSS